MSFQKLLGLAFFGLFIHQNVVGQIVYGSTLSAIKLIDLGACTSTTIVNVPIMNDICISPSGNFYGLNGINFVSINSTTGALTTIATVTPPGTLPSSLEWGQDGFLYGMGDRIWKVNPTTGAIVVTGILPSGWASVGDLVYLDGIYYGSVYTPSGQKLVHVNLTNPSASTIVSAMPTTGGFVAGASATDDDCPKLFWFKTAPNQVWAFTVSTQTWAPYCASYPELIGGGDSQNDYAFPFSCCSAQAGNVTATTQNLCGPTASATVPYTGGAIFGAGQGLRYILFSNLSNPAGSVLAQSATPDFSFNSATMTLGQTYFLGTVVGPLVNGNVDLTATCLDFSNLFAQVAWRALPSVALSASDPNFCAGGCATVTATFSGGAPFILTYQNPQTGTATATFSSNTGAFQICAPAGAAMGNLIVQAVSLTDAFCVCN